MAEREGLPRKQLDQAALERLEEAPLAGQRARDSKTSRAGSPRSIRRRRSRLPVIDAELAQPAVTQRCRSKPRADEEPVGRGRAQPRRRYFAGFGDGLPPPGLYHRILREIEYPLLSAALGGDSRQSDPRRGSARGQPQYAAQEDPRSRHPGLSGSRLTLPFPSANACRPVRSAAGIVAIRQQCCIKASIDTVSRPVAGWHPGVFPRTGQFPLRDQTSRSTSIGRSPCR